MIEENRSYAQMRYGMPFLARLSPEYGYADHWNALAYPSLPNYLGIANGAAAPPARVARGAHLRHAGATGRSRYPTTLDTL